MASSITLNATTAEGQLMELAEKLATLQASATNNPEGNTVISGYTRNMATETITFSVTLSTTDTTTSGNIVITAAESFVDS